MNRACAHGKMPFNRLLSGKRSSGANSMWVLVNGITWNATFFLVVIQYSVCCFYSPLIFVADVLFFLCCVCGCVCVCVFVLCCFFCFCVCVCVVVCVCVCVSIIVGVVLNLAKWTVVS